MSTIAEEHTFLYPVSRQYPFDEICEQIVRELEKRNWDVPGIEVEFSTYGSGASKYRMVQTIRSGDFKLWFCRPQRRLGPHNDIAAVTEISFMYDDELGGKELNVYDDESGPTLYVYVGKDYEADREWFLNSVKVNAKLNGEPRRYLQYSGACRCSSASGATFDALSLITGQVTSHSHPGRRDPLIVHDTDTREYGLKNGDPEHYKTSEIYEQFTELLKERVLAQILAQPEAEQKVDAFAQEAAPWPEDAPPIFCFGEVKDWTRIRDGRANPDLLQPGERYGMYGGGYRLVPFGTKGDVPKIAYDGFLWCGVGEVDGNTPKNKLDIPGHYSWEDRERFVLRITPKKADGVYIADHGAYEKRRKELITETERVDPERRTFTDDEVSDFVCARGRTIVPFIEYDGSYEQPVVLINRELALDEVELVSGPWPECYLAHLMAGFPGCRAKLVEAVCAYQGCYIGPPVFDARSREEYNAAFDALKQHVDGSHEITKALKQALKDLGVSRTDLDNWYYKVVQAVVYYAVKL